MSSCYSYQILITRKDNQSLEKHYLEIKRRIVIANANLEFAADIGDGFNIEQRSFSRDLSFINQKEFMSLHFSYCGSYGIHAIKTFGFSENIRSILINYILQTDIDILIKESTEYDANLYYEFFSKKLPDQNWDDYVKMEDLDEYGNPLLYYHIPFQTPVIDDEIIDHEDLINFYSVILNNSNLFSLKKNALNHHKQLLKYLKKTYKNIDWPEDTTKFQNLFIIFYYISCDGWRIYMRHQIRDVWLDGKNIFDYAEKVFRYGF